MNDQGQLANIFNEYYGNLVKTLELPNPPSEEVNSSAELSDLQMCEEKFKNHPSIMKIKENN